MSINRITKCGNCGYVNWNEDGCDSCDDGDGTEIDGREVDIDEMTENEELREFGAEHGYCKHEVTDVHHEDGTVEIRGYAPRVSYKDLA